jgi:hypothetical protein
VIRRTPTEGAVRRSHGDSPTEHRASSAEACISCAHASRELLGKREPIQAVSALNGHASVAATGRIDNNATASRMSTT